MTGASSLPEPDPMSRLKKRLIVVAFATALLLAVPAIGIHFGSRVGPR